MVTYPAYCLSVIDSSFNVIGKTTRLSYSKSVIADDGVSLNIVSGAGGSTGIHTSSNMYKTDGGVLFDTIFRDPSGKNYIVTFTVDIENKTIDAVKATLFDATPNVSYDATSGCKYGEIRAGGIGSMISEQITPEITRIYFTRKDTVSYDKMYLKCAVKNSSMGWTQSNLCTVNIDKKETGSYFLMGVKHLTDVSRLSLVYGAVYTNGACVRINSFTSSEYDLDNLVPSTTIHTVDPTIVENPNKHILMKINENNPVISGLNGAYNEDNAVMKNIVCVDGNKSDGYITVTVCETYDNDGSLRTLTGTMGRMSSHDKTNSGIYDLTGNIYEMVTGIRIASGELQVIKDNDAANMKNIVDGNWRAILQSGDYTDPSDTYSLKLNYDGKINTVAGKAMENIALSYITLAAATGVTVPMLLKSLGIFPIDATDHGDTANIEFKTAGMGYGMFGGSYLKSAIGSGIFNLNLQKDLNSYISPDVGFRVCYYKP